VSIEELRAEALRVKDLYDQLNHLRRSRTWTNEEFMLGFVGDVGDLAKLVMAQEGARELPGGRDALGHELADCLWSILILAEVYEIDLVAVFRTTMQTIAAHIRTSLNDSEPRA
jgi:NTP pyrophosphatase (non-canonical NTP hydrolase)